MKWTLLCLGLISFSICAFSQEAQKSPLKAFTDQQYFDILNGEEMGMARVAELNNYPSPLEVSKLEKELNLNPSQRLQLEKIIGALQFKAKEMAGFIFEQETKLNNVFAAGKATDGVLIYYTNKIGLYFGELRNAHLQAHLKTRYLLTAAQIKKYYQLRGNKN